MDNKIQELTNKLLTEGVEKGRAEAEKIIADAKCQSDDIIKSANLKAEEILSAARKEAQAMADNTKSELKMFAGQAVSALKTEIANVVTDSIVRFVSKSVVEDKEFMNSFILKLAEKWGAQEDITVSLEDAASLKALFMQKAKALLDKSVRIEQVHGQKALFTVAPQDGSYKVTFGEEEFENYFKSFLRPQLVDMLYN